MKNAAPWILYLLATLLLLYLTSLVPGAVLA